MKKLLLLFFLWAPGWTALAQEATPATLNFCGLDLPITAGCVPESKYAVRCQDYQMTWMYLDYGMLRTFPEQFMQQIQKKKKHLERQPLECTILGAPAKGFRLSYPTETGGMAYELIAYGVAKGQPVMVQLVLAVDPDKTADLPELPRQVIQLAK
ncbi:hypothetical protein HNQ93_002662 [Hymenobacter luteus]|uniref:Uncharacterized protein n=2 Tax=Hymenobacter TaxID=89966 RepID=A0A7W9T1B9_9BACT|nr:MULTISPECIES: hypothetical protein [Hymenobacter]MBB4601769.1 hypothetical protein [Hymenobacter latericoloratus]MBB6059802.1 hypothetical protein [Hymenobacter luteus]